ncbi:MAG: protein BatD [Calditrichaeota bacterium]|nr:protein BatD [Calditrichota bacterium]
MKQRILFPLLVFLFVFHTTFAQDSLKVAQQPAPENITVSTQVDRTTVPLNRTLTLHVSLVWQGDPDRYEIIDFENPALTNFEITGTSTSNKTEVVNGQVITHRDYDFILKPRELGMGYVEGVIVKYKDRVSGKEHSLVTQRISLKVVDPVPESHSSTHWPATVLYAALVIIFAGILWFFLIYRKSKKPVLEIEEIPPLEETYLKNLKEQITFENPDLKNGFSKLSKLLRSYLSEKFNLPAKQATTQELLKDMQNRAMDEKLISQTKEVLSVADEINFSGGSGSREELEKIYGTVESILERYLAAGKVHQANDETTSSIETEN